MNQNNLLAILRENRFMQTQQQVTDFENTLAEIADNPDEQNLSAYHLVLDNQCQHPEVMFSLIHFLESFETEEQITSFIKVVPQLMIDASEWTRIIHDRILNDDLSCQVYQKLLHSANLNTPHFLYHLLEESIVNKLKIK
ncbi:Imm30 family immunity protein [Nostoc sp. ChiVER01]|uniref:Imm30 family immunity protein n=1 Tax=Nostoc sp. ChiVER01 TaxID=3075382 RepID=UPI002AD43B14|nr:Imm30 family immunity protein [Nostoc sp. ChiVER01]MDZ8222518.1 Imm30 family immunity protein [Nostoc sp. ChiVER01]